MKSQAIVVFIYGLLLLIGGIIGHLKANSIASLAAGTIFAAMAIFSSIMIYKNNRWALTGAMAISLFLGVFFLYRFYLSYRFMPAGFMVIISLLVLGYLFLNRKK